jgi:dienelactone hydrolase
MNELDPDRRGFPAVNAPEYPLPASLAEWSRRRESTQRTLDSLLGDLPPRPGVPNVDILETRERDGYCLEKLAIDNGAGATIPAFLLIPKGRGPFPALLYLHWHAGRYALGKDELWETIPGGEARRGEELVRRGYVVLAPDAYAFGERSGRGPGGPEERGGAEELTLSKVFLWMGRTLWGMIVRDDRIALDVLASRPEVDAARIGATGISMGSTRTWWLAALDDRIRAAVAVCCLTRYQELIADGRLQEHGIYYFVPGMLRHFDAEAVASLIPPRPFLTLSGADDPGSPARGVARINAFCAALAELCGKPEHFRGILYPGVGHCYTPEMWKEMTAWFEKHLRKT